MAICKYLARVMPDKNRGGRQGFKVYERLLALVGPYLPLLITIRFCS